MANGTGQSPVSNLLLQQATRRQPIIDPLQSVGRLALAFAGRRRLDQERADRRARTQARVDELRRLGEGSDIEEVQALAKSITPENVDALSKPLIERLLEGPEESFTTLDQAQSIAAGFQAGDVVQENELTREREVLRKADKPEKGTQRAVLFTDNLDPAKAKRLGINPGDRRNVIVMGDGSAVATDPRGNKVPLGSSEILSIRLGEEATPGGTVTDDKVRRRKLAGSKDVQRAAISSTLDFMNNVLTVQPQAVAGVVPQTSEIIGKVAGAADLIGMGSFVRSMQGSFTRAFANTDPETIRKIGVQAKLQLSNNLELITGDTSRYSDQDMRRAEGAFALTDPTADPVAAIVNAKEFAVMKVMRDFQWAAANGVQPELQLSKDVKENAAQFRARGMEIEAAIEMAQLVAERFDFYTVVSPFRPRGTQ